MIKLSPSQLEVVEAFPAFLMDDTQEMTISGFAGSGKTFLVKYLIEEAAIKHQKMLRLIDADIPQRKILLSATTNKAATVLEQTINKEVKTIHSLLGLKVQNNYRTGATTLTYGGNETRLTNSILFIDEASMISHQLLQILRERLKEYPTCKVVFIGDSYQLPPVKEDVCPIFNKSDNTFFLREIQRQVAGNPIIQLSAQYRDCLDNHEKEWPTIPHDGKHIVYYEDKMDYFAAIKKAYTAPHAATDYKVVAWANSRVNEYNTWIRNLQGYFKPYEAGETVVSNKPLFHGSNLIASTDTLHEIHDVQDGHIDGVPGFIIELAKYRGAHFFQPADWKVANRLAAIRAKEAKKTRDWSGYFQIKEQWTDLRPVHSSTVHKAQGSTYREVFVDLNNIGLCNQWRDVARLVYVAITRASETAHIYGKLSKKYNKAPKIDHMEPFKHVDCL